MAVGPIMNPRYLPSVAHVYWGRSFVYASGGWSPNGMAIVLTRLMSMVVMLLHADITLSSCLECFPQEGMHAVVSSVKVLMCTFGSFVLMMRRA